MRATRDSFGEELARLGAENSQIVVLDADLSKSTKSNAFAKKFPNRFFEMGIAEANMIGTAAGLALSGKIAFACSFGCFLTGRYDQIRMSVAYNRANVKLIGTHSGVAIGEDGHSQMGLDDVALLRSLPEFSIYQPADDFETKAIIRYVVKNEGACYIRLTRQKVPNLYSQEFEFQPGKWTTLKSGKNVAVIGSGGLTGNALKAAEGKEWTVVNASSLNPIDKDCIRRLTETHAWIITAEDHYTVGGLGSAVAEILAETATSAKLHRIGVDTFGESGEPDEIYKHYGFDAESLRTRIQKIADA